MSDLLFLENSNLSTLSYKQDVKLSDTLLFPGLLNPVSSHDSIIPITPSYINNYFEVSNALSELKTSELRDAARKNLGIDDVVEWGEIKGNLEEQKDLNKYIKDNTQNPIKDLDEIRSGAAAGASALQADDLKGYATEEYVGQKIADLVDGAPEALDTLNELSAALKDNTGIVDVLNESIGKKQDALVSGESIKTINGESILGEGNIEVTGGGSTDTIAGTLNIKDLNAVKAAQELLSNKQQVTYIITDANGNYPSPTVNTVYLDDVNSLKDLFCRGNDLALRYILDNGEAYYKYLGSWSSENIRKYVKLPQYNMQTAKVGDLITIIRHDFTSDEFYSKYIDFDSIEIDNTAFQTAKTFAGYGDKSDGEYIKHMIASGNIYSAESDPNKSPVTTYPLAIDGKVQFYTAQITPNTQKVYSGEFWPGNMTGPGIYSYVTIERPEGSEDGEFYIGYVSPNGAQTLVSMKNPSKVFTRPNLNSSWNLGGVQKIINDDLYRTKYGYANKADSCLKTGVNNYFSDTIGGITANWSLFVTCSSDGDPNYYHLLQTAVCRDDDKLGRIFQRMGWYKGNGEDLHFTDWKEVGGGDIEIPEDIFDKMITSEPAEGDSEEVEDYVLMKSDIEHIIPHVVDQTDSTATIQPNVLNVWGEVASLEITLAEPTDNTIVNEYMAQFVSGATATTLTLPSTIKWMAVPNIQPNKTYQLSVINNLGVIGEFSHE